MASEKSENCSVQYGSRTIPVRVYRRNRRSVGIVVNPEQSVYAYVPTILPGHELQRILEKKARWMVKKLDEQAACYPLPWPETCASGDVLVYLGRQYTLNVLQGEKGPATLKDGYLHLPVSARAKNGAAEKALENWYREQAHTLFRSKLEEYLKAPPFQEIPEPDLSIRKMRRRWGSCTAKGRITLNLYLILVPIACIDYVIMHEVCHLAVRGHNPRFYDLLTDCMPDWRQRKQQLDHYRLT